ncbi:hypothetical protein [Flavipsychrobacter stenotrophus]|nr:hypothetical protein [Flavipsychrobacter stenotrophus]
MGDVINKEYYHIQRTTRISNFEVVPNLEKWQTDNEINFGEIYNSLRDRIFQINFDVTKELELLSRLSRSSAFDFYKNQVQSDFFHNGFLLKYLQLLRETVLEVDFSLKIQSYQV